MQLSLVCAPSCDDILTDVPMLQLVRGGVTCVWSCVVGSFTGMGRVWQLNVKVNLKDVCWAVCYVYLARYIARWRTVVDTVTNCRPSYR